MKENSMLKNKLKIHDKVYFSLPYLDGLMKFNGVIVDIKTNSLIIKYKTCIGEKDPYNYNTLTTEIPFSFLIEKSTVYY